MLLSLSQAKFSHCTPLFEDNSYARDEFGSFCFGSDRCRETRELLFFNEYFFIPGFLSRACYSSLLKYHIKCSVKWWFERFGTGSYAISILTEMKRH